MPEVNDNSSAVKHFKLRIQGNPYVEGDWKRPSIGFDLWMGNPSLVCWSESPDEDDDVKRYPIQARTSWPRLRGLLEHLLTLKGKVEPKRYVMPCLTVPKDENGEKTGGPLVKQAEVHYGRLPSGALFMEIRQKGRVNLPAYFQEDIWHKLYTEGAEISLAEHSDVIMVGMVKTIIDTYSQEFVNKYQSPTPRDTVQKEY